MWEYALLILAALTAAAVIGFVSAWQLQRPLIEHSKDECERTMSHLKEISDQLHLFRKKEENINAPVDRLNACETELRKLETELENLLRQLNETRSEISA